VIADEPATLQVRSSRTVHHGMVWDVRRDAVDLGDGQTVTREVVDHTGAVGVVVLDAEDNPVLVNPAARAMGLLRSGGAPGTMAAHPIDRKSVV